MWPDGSDFTTPEVLPCEVEVISRALDEGRVLLSAHAANEAALDGLSLAELLDTVAFMMRSAKTCAATG